MSAVIATHKITDVKRTMWGVESTTRRIDIEACSAVAGGYEQVELHFKGAVLVRTACYPANTAYAAQRRAEIGMEW